MLVSELQAWPLLLSNPNDIRFRGVLADEAQRQEETRSFGEQLAFLNQALPWSSLPQFLAHRIADTSKAWFDLPDNGKYALGPAYLAECRGVPDMLSLRDVDHDGKVLDWWPSLFPLRAVRLLDKHFKVDAIPFVAKRVPRLSALGIRSAHVSEVLLRLAASELVFLNDLTLWHAWGLQENIRHVTNFLGSRLRALRLEGCSLSLDGVAELIKAGTALEKICISELKVLEGDRVTQLVLPSTLTHLCLRGIWVERLLGAEFRQLPSTLQHLEVSNVRVRSNALSQLATCSSVETLRIRSTDPIDAFPLTERFPGARAIEIGPLTPNAMARLLIAEMPKRLVRFCLFNAVDCEALTALKGRLLEQKIEFFATEE